MSTLSVFRDVLRETHFFSWEHWTASAHNAIKLFPLMSAIIAPLSVLLDIPALSQPWYGHEGQKLTDEKTSLILSSFSLFFNVVANAFLLLRFSIVSRAGYTRATRMSMVFWLLKAAIALVNLITFGVYRNNGPGYQYLEGFWCAVVSCVLASISAIMLVLHYLYEFNPAVALKHNEVRLRGRGFMINVTLLITTLGIQGLIFSRIEHWTYLDGIYFSTVSVLTVGFGDFSPSTTAGKILLFPLVLMGIAQLGVCVSAIIDYFSEKSMDITRAARYHVEVQRLRKEMTMESVDIHQELKFLEKAKKDQENREGIVMLIKSSASFLCLWLIGALIFSKLESWTYGNSLYFNYVFFLTLGYGDFSPSTSAGRVVFIVYALLAVPIITSFAVQSITKTMSILSARGILRHTKRVIPETAPVDHHQLLDEAAEDLIHQTHVKELDDLLIKTALQMDMTVRKLLLVTLKGRSNLMLKADTIVQLRNSNIEYEHFVEQFHDIQVSTELNNYRRQFARFLAISSAVKKLEGEEQRVFERRLKNRSFDLELSQEKTLDTRDDKSSASSETSSVASHSSYLLDHEFAATGIAKSASPANSRTNSDVCENERNGALKIRKKHTTRGKKKSTAGKSRKKHDQDRRTAENPLVEELQRNVEKAKAGSGAEKTEEDKSATVDRNTNALHDFHQKNINDEKDAQANSAEMDKEGNEAESAEEYDESSHKERYRAEALQSQGLTTRDNGGDSSYE